MKFNDQQIESERIVEEDKKVPHSALLHVLLLCGSGIFQQILFVTGTFNNINLHSLLFIFIVLFRNCQSFSIVIRNKK